VLSLVAGLAFAVIAVSGAIIVFRFEVDRTLYPPMDWNGEAMAYAEAKELAQAAEPDKQLSLLWFPNRARPFYEAGYLDPQGEISTYRFHPTDGSELVVPEPSFMKWMTRFHTDLHLGEAGRWIVAHATLIGFVLLLSGIALWWPGWKPHLWFRIRWRKPVLNWDLHRVAGMTAMPVLLLCVVTGLAMAFPNAARTVVWGLTGKSVPAQEGTLPYERPSTPPQNGEPVVEVSDQALLADARSRAPKDAFVFYITYPSRPDENRQVRMQLGYDPWPLGEIYRYYYDRYDGRLLGAEDPRTAAAPDAFLGTWVDPLHYGTWGGVATQLFYLVATLVPGLLAVTGWILWRRRVKRTRERKQRIYESRSLVRRCT